MNRKILFFIIAILGLVAIVLNYRSDNLPIVAIANYGPHTSLQATIVGLKDEMVANGFIEDETVKYKIMDVGFDTSLINQMITNLKSSNPHVMVVMTTPVAQAAKSMIHNIPLVYSVITDPIGAGLIQENNMSYGNITGSSDMQDLDVLLQFAKLLLPNAQRVGLLYSTSESNDVALVNMVRDKSKKFGIEVVAVPVEQARDVPIRVQQFNGQVDFIYVGTSGPIQPTLPVIAAEAKKMHIPVFNADQQAVKDGLALASFGVDYNMVGKNTGQLVAAILKGKSIAELSPVYPSLEGHHGIVNKKLADEFNVSIPQNVEVVE